MTSPTLKLLALDSEDLAIVSAHLQDAVVKVADLVYLQSERRFAFAASRFDWLAAAEGKGNHRRRVAVHFDRVRSVKIRGIDREQPGQVLCLLAMSYEDSGEPSGWLQLDFAGGPSIRLEVECVEARMADLGPTWEARCCPEHAETIEPVNAAST